MIYQIKEPLPEAEKDVIYMKVWKNDSGELRFSEGDFTGWKVFGRTTNTYDGVSHIIRGYEDPSRPTDPVTPTELNVAAGAYSCGDYEHACAAE